MSKRKVVQVFNPNTKRYIKVNRLSNEVISRKLTSGPYANVPIVMRVEGLQEVYRKTIIPPNVLHQQKVTRNKRRNLKTRLCRKI